jgi:hypothetical protein
MIVPVLAAMPVETIIWIVLVAIGVISSIVSNARKAVKAATAVQRNAPQRRTVPQRVSPPRTVVMQAMPPAPPQAPPPAAPPPQAVAPPPIVRRRAEVTPAPAPRAHGTGAFRGMFERGNLVRAIVAAEVLGPPKALQEQSIWSPRHSEPSI